MLEYGTPKNINFSFETNGKLMALGAPILKHFRVMHKVYTDKGGIKYSQPCLKGSPKGCLKIDCLRQVTI